MVPRLLKLCPTSLLLALGLLPAWVATASGESPTEGSQDFETELVFPLHPQHNHAPGIVECPNGDLLVSWYRGSGERRADDVAVFGARKRKGSARWSPAFVMADVPGFPDGNTALHIDRRGRLWLFWPTILANTWESSITQCRVSSDYADDGPPKWEWQSSILLRPLDFEKVLLEALDARLGQALPADSSLPESSVTELRERIRDRLSQRLGWQPRCKPTVLPSGRILLPLYSDTYSVSLMAISDDDGATWSASRPLAGFGNIQPSVLRRADGTLVAYMRENGPLLRIRVAKSTDNGVTWGPVGVTSLPNPGAGLDAVRLESGRWLLVYNDTIVGRNRLAVSMSDDEGNTWRWTRHLERHPTGSYHYPAVIQARDGTIHVAYSYFVEDGKSIKHAAFREGWVERGQSPAGASEPPPTERARSDG